MGLTFFLALLPLGTSIDGEDFYTAFDLINDDDFRTYIRSILSLDPSKRPDIAMALERMPAAVVDEAYSEELDKKGNDDSGSRGSSFLSPLAVAIAITIF